MTRKELGDAGENFAAKLLLSRENVLVAQVAHERYAGDVRVILDTGEVKRVEVKTSTLNRDGNFRFTLVKDGHTNHIGADYVVCLCVYEKKFVIPFVIPASACDDVRVVAIPKHTHKYSGKWAQYFDAWDVIE